MKPPFPNLLPRLATALCGVAFAIAFSSNPLPASDAIPSIPATGSLEVKARQELESMMDKLNLSEAQEIQVRPVFEDAMSQGKVLMQNALKALMGKKTSDEKAAALQKVKADFEAMKADSDRRIAAILTPEQMQEYKKLRNQRGSELKKDYKK
ncbi:MAG TPA: hypothetical protein VK956_05440 [Verrucomicrobium sp.]|nr:hypothetical protein [Verrucomicrobium sp.]